MMAFAEDVSHVRYWPALQAEKPLISVLLPCWHGEDTIETALDSVEAQEGLPTEIGVELVLVIDGREQDYRAVCVWVECQGDGRRWPITLVMLNRNCGVGLARMIGEPYCQGEFLAFLDDDDVWHSQKLLIQWMWHQANPQRMASSHGYGVTPVAHEVSFWRLILGGCRVSTPTVMIRRSLWPYKPEPYRFAEDWLMMAMISVHQRIPVLPHHLASRSKLAPALLSDAYSLTRQRAKMRLGKIKAILLLSQRGVLHPVFVPPLVLWNGCLILRRWTLDGIESLEEADSP